MYAITGITGKVGGALARKLLAEGHAVRAVLRDATKAGPWAAQGCQIAFAGMEEPARLAAGFEGVEGVFILPPSEFDPAPGYPEARIVIDAVTAALKAAKPKKILCLSTIGADAPHDNLLSQRTLMEEAVGALGLPVTFLRPGWFMENALWDVASAREGILHSFLQPADKRFPMVATQDVGSTAAELLVQDWDGARVVELEGPVRVSPNDVASAFATALGRSVRVEVVQRSTWEELFTLQGMNHPLPRIRMLDGFNEGWIDFADNGASAIKGPTPLADVIAKLVR
ncbi:NmrA family NAD(P)-binding protein [Nguyenibacter vanlangensis]|uniref:NmrA family NAD(P)-binding protein n=1 Tax=Nguyenibacter vanlangensis TaxID=1216886 RepID=A0ABZ3D2Y8_9PROT